MGVRRPGLRRAVISTITPFLANDVYTVRNGLARGLKRRGGLGFLPRFSHSVEESFIQKLDFTGQTVYDVGGYEGIFTLFFCRRIGPSGRLITYEPNPRNVDRIRENVRLNGFANVEVRPLALGATPGHATLVFPSDETARGSLQPDIQSSLQMEKHVGAVEVEIDTIDRQIALGAPEPDFVKIDVEGFERDVLEGMSTLLAWKRPQLYIEIHGADVPRKIENARSVIEFVWRAGYGVYHVESGTTVETPAQIALAREGHIYCH
jgi:FkbM family methyltransferase